jgi:hypothetical protein
MGISTFETGKKHETHIKNTYFIGKSMVSFRFTKRYSVFLASEAPVQGWAPEETAPSGAAIGTSGVYTYTYICVCRIMYIYWEVDRPL